MRLAPAAALFVALLLGSCAAPTERLSGAELPHPTTLASGWSEGGLAEAEAWSRHIHSTAVIVIQHDAVVAQWGDVTKRTELASVRKSFLSALIGIAVANGQISLDKTLAELDIDDVPPALSPAERQATVRMLLEARSGIYHPALYETPAMAAHRPARYSHEPGSFWYYNNWDFNALGTIYEHATRTGIYDALDRQIARPIGMQDYRPEDGEYFYGPASLHRAYPIRMSARDLARFALLYLHHGAWGGRQVVPAAWVEESTKTYSPVSPRLGYGYLWWTTGPESVVPAGSFSARGAGGQYAYVIPAYDMVVVSRVDRDQHLPEPSGSDVEELMRLIFQSGHLGH